ncbi:MAG TPA: DUF3726 domain-containing protein [Dongiaceae bacterium]|nr:DUF3726 domain-containing protein [Dongiaceae bacterium]
MQLSLNEIQVESRKAARGAGLPWGLAEEAGYAMAWLAERGIDASAALLDILNRQTGESVADDPLSIGAAIADQAQMLAEGEVLAFAQIRQPVLVLPFMATAARLSGNTVLLQHEDGVWSVRPEGADLALFAAAVKRPRIVAVKCRAEALPLRDTFQIKSTARAEMDEGVWRQLQKLAHRTYVPASEQSRRLGAGAGSIDND